MAIARDIDNTEPQDSSKEADAPRPRRNGVEEAATHAETEPDTPIELPEGPDPEIRLAQILKADNPLLEAASVLLRAQAEMPHTLESKYLVRKLRLLLEEEIRNFQTLCERANIRRDHAVAADYCLCTALDEAAMQTTWGGKGANRDTVSAWPKEGLASTFHQDRNGGDKVYYLIGRLMTEPKEHHDLLEVIYQILSLGFEGRLRHVKDGGRQHDAVRLRLYTEIMSDRPPVPVALSPHWQGDTTGKRRPFYDFPVWITVVVLSVILLAFYGYSKYDLMTRSAKIQAEIADIARMKPPPAPPALHLKELLREQIAAGKVSVDEDEHHSSVTFRGDDMFGAGNAAVNPSMQPLVGKIAAEIVKVPGQVTVIGHSDNQPVRSRASSSNQVLSEERATQVMHMLQDAGVSSNRMKAIGKGDTAPVADNQTPQGRAQNRRVDINVAFP